MVSETRESHLRKESIDTEIGQQASNCFACHVKAHAQWYMVCETDYGCDPRQIATRMIGAWQRAGPRCRATHSASAHDAAALKELDAIVRDLGSPG